MNTLKLAPLVSSESAFYPTLILARLMHLSMQSPTRGLPGQGGDLSICRCKGLTPGAILFDKPLANTPGHDSFTSTIYSLLAIL